MPFDHTSPISPGSSTVGIAEADRPDPSFVDTLSAAFRQENLIGSFLSDARMGVSYGDLHKVDPTFNPFEDVAGYEKEAADGAFDEVHNRKAFDAVRSNIDKERKDKRTLAASGWEGLGLSMLASVADPTILLPGGAFVDAGRVGYSALRSAAAVGGAAALATGIQEAGLQSSQETRPLSQSALAVGGSAVLGGLLGAAGAKFLSKTEWDRVGKSLSEDLRDEVPNPDQVTQTIVSRMQAAGAAAVDDIKLDDLGVGGPKAAQAVARATAAAKINPGIQTMFSPSKLVRKTYAEMVDNPVYTKMNMEGMTLGSDVENLVKQYERGNLGQWLTSSRKLYRDAKKAGYEGTKTDFYEAVSKAARRGDVDVNGNEFVTRAAQETRAKIFDPLLVRAKETGLLPEDVHVTTAASYVTRMWNREKLIGEEDKFREIARRYFREQIGKIPEKDRPDFVSEADLKDYVEEAVTSVFNNLTARGKGDIPDWIVPVKQGPLKERTFNIPDQHIEGFLRNDMELIARHYVRKMGAEVELARKFGRPDMKDQFDAINKEYDQLSAEAKTPSERQKLDKLRRRDIGNLEAFRDMIRGTYRAAENSSEWSKITRAALTWNYIRLLGGVTLSSLSDASRLIGVHGIRATMSEALPSLVSKVKAVKISKSDARDLGAIAESVLQSRLASLADIQDPYAHGSKFDRFLSNTSHVFTKATCLGWWNDTMKTMASVMTQNRMMRNSLNWKGAGAREQAYMAYLGIDEDMAARIAGQFKKYGAQEQGVYGANVGDWDDDLAARAWGAALRKDVDRTIVTPGVADRPLWTRTNAGKILFQFKSFALASHQRVLLSGLQERPHRLLEQMVFGTAVGMMIGYVKFIERGDFDRAERLLDNPGLWIADGLDRTGILSLPFEFSNTADKLNVNSLGGVPLTITGAAQALAGDSDRGGTVSRYASRNQLGTVLGPTAGLFRDLATIADQISKGDLKRGGANAIIRQVPGATLPIIRTAIHVKGRPALQEAVE